LLIDPISAAGSRTPFGDRVDLRVLGATVSDSAATFSSKDLRRIVPRPTLPTGAAPEHSDGELDQSARRVLSSLLVTELVAIGLDE
jgi:hypothetical protein